MTMSLACRIHAAFDLRLETVEPPEPSAREARIRLGAGSICGSDLHYFQHGRVGAFVLREPLIPGHEVSGCGGTYRQRGDASATGR